MFALTGVIGANLGGAEVDKVDTSSVRRKRGAELRAGGGGWGGRFGRMARRITDMVRVGQAFSPLIAQRR